MGKADAKGERQERDPAAAKPARDQAQKDRQEHLDEALDEALDGTFPASDPVALTPGHDSPSADED